MLFIHSSIIYLFIYSYSLVIGISYSHEFKAPDMSLDGGESESAQ